MLAQLLDYLPASNYSVHAIPIYLFLSITPQLYAVRLVQKRAISNTSPSSKHDQKKPDAIPRSVNAPGSLTTILFGPNWRPDSPRSSELRTAVQRILTPEDFSTYERAQAAHQNCMENLPVFFSAVIVANFPGVGFGAAGGVIGARVANAFVALYLMARMGYIVAYIFSGGSKKHLWPLRSMFYHVSSLMSVAVLFVVAEKVRKGGGPREAI